MGDASWKAFERRIARLFPNGRRRGADTRGSSTTPDGIQYRRNAAKKRADSDEGGCNSDDDWVNPFVYSVPLFIDELGGFREAIFSRPLRQIFQSAVGDPSSARKCVGRTSDAKQAFDCAQHFADLSSLRFASSSTASRTRPGDSHRARPRPRGYLLH